MSRQKGISIYPFHAWLKDNCEYIVKAAHYGFTRPFTSVLSIDTSKKAEIISEFKKTIEFAEKKVFKLLQMLLQIFLQN